MNPTIDNNWIEENRDKLGCTNLSVFALRSLEVALAYEKLVEQNADLVNPAIDDMETQQTLKGLYDKIACGNLLSENEYGWALAEIARLSKIIYEATDARLKAVVEDQTHYIFAAGIHSWAGGAATTDVKTVAGALATDVVIATLRAQGASEVLVKAITDTNNITFTLSANGTNTTTKINWQILRAKPAS